MGPVKTLAAGTLIAVAKHYAARRAAAPFAYRVTTATLCCPRGRQTVSGSGM